MNWTVLDTRKKEAFYHRFRRWICICFYFAFFCDSEREHNCGFEVREIWAAIFIFVLLFAIVINVLKQMSSGIQIIDVFWIKIMQQFAVASLTLGSLCSKCLIVLMIVRVFFFSHCVIILSAFKHVCPLLSFSTSFWNPRLGLGLFKMIKIIRKLFVVWCGRDTILVVGDLL